MSSDPLEKTSLHNQAQPVANTNILAANLAPTNTPSIFRIQILMSNQGNFSVIIISGGNSQTGILNESNPLIAGALYIFDILVHSGDTINFRYSVGGGTIQTLKVQELFG